MPVWSNGYKISWYDGFQIRWRCNTAVILSAHMSSDREVSFICIFPTLLFLNDYVRGNHFRKVIHYKMCVDFLLDAHHLFWMKIQHSCCIFQVSERCFYPPYADILEMPINHFLKSHAWGNCQAWKNNIGIYFKPHRRFRTSSSSAYLVRMFFYLLDSFIFSSSLTP